MQRAKNSRKFPKHMKSSLIKTKEKNMILLVLIMILVQDTTLILLSTVILTRQEGAAQIFLTFLKLFLVLREGEAEDLILMISSVVFLEQVAEQSHVKIKVNLNPSLQFLLKKHIRVQRKMSV